MAVIRKQVVAEVGVIVATGLKDIVPRQVDLSGDWDFAYAPGDGDGAVPELLPANRACCSMPMPGFWDDYVERLNEAYPAVKLRFSSAPDPVRFPMHGLAPDASLSHVIGIGQYECRFDAPAGARLTFEGGPTFLESCVWVNGKFVGRQPHYSTAWSMPLDGLVEPGASNRLSLQVANTDPRTMGCITRGYSGYAAGVVGPVGLRITGPARIADCYIHPAASGDILNWRVEVDRPADPAPMTLRWRVVDPETDVIVQEQARAVNAGANSWQTTAAGLSPWSDRSPTLYRIEIELWDRDVLSDVLHQRFGLRTIAAEGFGLRLNGQPIYLRGATEHAYFPQTCTLPLDKSYHRHYLRQLKALGFNWLRFHTWVPPEAYMDAADELGMLIQVETPAGADEHEWRDVLRACRRHPSVMIYCAGNEELLDEAKLDQLESWAAARRELAPDALFSPQEALRGIEYGWSDTDFGPGVVQEPYPHNPARLERVRSFADCFGQFAWGLHSYNSTACDPQLIDARLEDYQRPCLSHEVCIHGSYIDLDLEHRYTGTRIGTDLYAAARRHLREHGLEKHAALYYRNSCAWMRRLRKHAVENARRSCRVAGYDLLGAHDHHWHRTGYPCGIMNEFAEMKPGETAEEVRRYNNSSVLLLDHRGGWVASNAERWTGRLSTSLFDEVGPGSVRVDWQLRDEAGRVYRRGEATVDRLTVGSINDLIEISFDVPDFRAPRALVLAAQLSSSSLQIDNTWPIFVYPPAFWPDHRVRFADDLAERWAGQSGRAGASPPDHEGLRVVSALGDADVDALAAGGRILLLGARPFASRVTVFQIACAGRAEGNLATCIHDHPITRSLPHAGFCDWDFQRMLDGGEAVLGDVSGLPFDPIIEVVSSFKDIQKQAALFELRVGRGRLLVCSLGLAPDDAAAVHLLGACIGYANSSEFSPAHALEPGVLRALVADRNERQELAETDQGFDERAALKHW
ncbi:MAG: hypothetical protein WD294_08060 [Phycisphaeraceae bacterium]